jgi:hypothetical protein
MDLDLICTSKEPGAFSETVKIFSDGKKTEVTVGEKTFKGPSMSGGTEGGPFYAQYFDTSNKISINFFGGDIEKLETTQSIANATTPVSFKYGKTSAELICQGKLAYIELDWGF